MRVLILVLSALAGSATACFGGVIFLDSLPTNNLNDAAGILRSNAAFGESDPTSAFDATSITFNSDIDITSISIWSVASVYGEALGQEFSSVSLYFRAADGTWVTLATGSPDTTFDVPGQPNQVGSSNPNMLFTQVSYNPPVSDPSNSYEGVGTPGVYYPIWQNTFGNLGLVLGPGTYQFGINGVGANPDPDSGYGYWYTSFVNPTLSGSPQSSNSGTYLRCSYLDLSGPCFVENTVADATWPVQVDMNIEIDGSTIAATPEPGSGAMLGIGLLAVGLSGLVANFRCSRSSI
jgi:hypothetical protein